MISVFQTNPSQFTDLYRNINYKTTYFVTTSKNIPAINTTHYLKFNKKLKNNKQVITQQF